MLLPDPKRMILEPGKQIWQTAGEGSVNTEFVDHICLIAPASRENFLELCYTGEVCVEDWLFVSIKRVYLYSKWQLF